MTYEKLNRRMPWFSLVLAALAGGCSQDAGDTRPAIARVEPAERTVENFTLIERNGEPFESDSLRGKVWVASFFFANCPGICLKMNQSIADLQKELDPEVRFVSITVDPDHDTPEVLNAYAQRVGATDRWLFLTGSMRDIKDIANDSFQVAAAPAAHSERLMLVDRQGRVRGSYLVSDGAQMTLLIRKVAELLKEPS
ncbi:MAG: SCO family protein [Pirellulales bacterium]|nr:SCO family protein [Pirellulales bacterium]